jgi:drug/metabolite transporter (DMT)-like permease
VAKRREGGPDGATLVAFVAIVLIGGVNFVAVRFSNRELAPFYGAAVRFLAASALLFLFVAIRKVPLPSGRSLFGTLVYGVLGFAAFYALAYWALQNLSAAAAAVLVASVPLLTLFFAVLHRVERFRMRGVLGGLLAVSGIAVLVSGSSGLEIPLASVLAMLGAVACAAESTVILKRFAPSNPVSANALAMLIGGALLVPLSIATGESWVVPHRQATWVTLAYLVPVGSVGLFAFYLFSLKRWTASGVSYMFVLTPIVASIASLILEDTSITLGLVVGGLVVLGGVYLGAFTGAPAKEAPQPVPECCPPVQEEVLAVGARGRATNS